MEKLNNAHDHFSTILSVVLENAVSDYNQSRFTLQCYYWLHYWDVVVFVAVIRVFAKEKLSNVLTRAVHYHLEQIQTGPRSGPKPKRLIVNIVVIFVLLGLYCIVVCFWCVSCQKYNSSFVLFDNIISKYICETEIRVRCYKIFLTHSYFRTELL